MNIEMPPFGITHPGLGSQPGADGPPLVSIIVTNHNYGRFLRSCLANIHAQTYPNIECIVIDDASTDDSCAVLDDMIDRGAFNAPGRSLQVIKSAVNLKMIGAACKAFERATGSYIIFFDADDIMLPHLVEAHVTAFFYCRIGVGISSADMFYVQNDAVIRAGHPGLVHFIHEQAAGNQVVFRKTTLPFAICRAEMSEPALALAPSELYHLPPERPGWAWAATSALCFRREMVEQMFRRVPNISGCLDAYLLRGIHPFTGAILIDRPLAAYRIHRNNDWIKFAPIENFMNWDINREVGVTRLIADEILQTHLLNADFYGQSLYNHETYIQAIDWLYNGSDRWSAEGPGSLPFSMKVFLTTNESLLRSAFGETTYRQWMARFGPIGTVKNLLRRIGLWQAGQAILRRFVDEQGMLRLRALLYR